MQVHAEAHLPSLDFCNGVEVPAEDTTGEPHTFKFRYWINNSSRMYLLEGTQKIQSKYSVKIGDVLTFARGSDSKLLVSQLAICRRCQNSSARSFLIGFAPRWSHMRHVTAISTRMHPWAADHDTTLAAAPDVNALSLRLSFSSKLSCSLTKISWSWLKVHAHLSNAAPT